MSWIWEWTSRLTWLEMNMQVDVVPLPEKAAPKLVLGNRPDCQNEMFLQGDSSSCYLDRSPLSQPFCSGRALRLSSNARGHQWTFPAQFMTQRMLNLGRWRWAGQAEVCFGAWLLPHCLSELGNSTTLSASLGQDMWPREPEVWPGWFLYLHWGCPPVLVQIENRRRIVLSY